MDLLESKSSNLLNNLKKLHKKHVERHIDQQINLWLRSTSTPQQPPQPPQPNQETPQVKSEPLSPRQEETLTPTTTPTTTATTTTTATATTTTTTNTTTTTTTQPQDEQQQQQQLQLQPTHFLPGSTIDHDDRTIGCLLSNLKHLENYDSDETESLSSNDSYDELEGFNHEDIPPKKGKFYYPPSTPHQINPQHPRWSDLKEKAIWKWANERSRLASRWTWLQAQVADLEFRIRGQNEATLFARAHKIPPLPPVLPENSCSRTVPINRDFRRRRLIRSSQILSDSNKKLVKFAHVPCACSSLPQTVAPCISCNGKYNYLRQLEGENLPLTERVSLLDPCCHPVLSFPDDITLGSQLAYILKQETINRKPSKRRPGRKKGSTAASLAAAAAAAVASGADSNRIGSGRHQDQKNKYYTHRSQGLRNPSQTMLASDKLKRKYRKHSSTNNNFESANWGNSNNSSYSTGRNKRIRSASSMHDTNSVYISESSNHSRPNHFSSGTNYNSAQGVSRRRRSEQSAYDIDNIVIPFSIAATTRVEVLEYKEIMTPSWRVWENGTCETEHRADEEAEVEDTSDEAYITRHSKGENEERKRFSLKPPKVAGHQTTASQ